MFYFYPGLCSLHGLMFHNSSCLCSIFPQSICSISSRVNVHTTRRYMLYNYIPASMCSIPHWDYVLSIPESSSIDLQIYVLSLPGLCSISLQIHVLSLPWANVLSFSRFMFYPSLSQYSTPYVFFAVSLSRSIFYLSPGQCSIPLCVCVLSLPESIFYPFELALLFMTFIQCYV